MKRLYCYLTNIVTSTCFLIACITLLLAIFLNTAYALTEKEIYQQFGACTVRIVTDTGIGSGFFINSFGYIATCAHVVQEANRIQVDFQGQLRDCEIVVVKKEADQAVIRLRNPPSSGTPYVKVHQSYFFPNVDNLDNIIVMGFPLGISKLNVNIGRISAVYEDETVQHIYQSDVTINPGNSGGPAFSMDGAVIGIATFKIDTSKIPNVSGMHFFHSIYPLIVHHKFLFQSEYEQTREIYPKAAIRKVNSFEYDVLFYRFEDPAKLEPGVLQSIPKHRFFGSMLQSAKVIEKDIVYGECLALEFMELKNLVGFETTFEIIEKSEEQLCYTIVDHYYSPLTSWVRFKTTVNSSSLSCSEKMNRLRQLKYSIELIKSEALKKCIFHRMSAIID